MPKNKNNKLVWVTDPHLNFVKEEKIKRFAKSLLSRKPNALVITGDIAEAQNLEFYLRFLEMHTNKVPTYFVCGNHDYYNGSITKNRQLIKSTFGPSSYTKYLPACGVVSLPSEAGQVALVGHDGWYDGDLPVQRAWFNSRVDLNDYYCIEELTNKGCGSGLKYAYYDTEVRETRYKKLKALAKQSADYFREIVPKAFETHQKVFFCTHVPPFEQNSKGPNGKISNADWMPHFSSKQMGDAIIDIMTKVVTDPQKELVVLCGHSHTAAWHKPLKNVTCITGKARYGDPKLANVFNY